MRRCGGSRRSRRASRPRVLQQFGAADDRGVVAIIDAEGNLAKIYAGRAWTAGEVRGRSQESRLARRPRGDRPPTSPRRRRSRAMMRPSAQRLLARLSRASASRRCRGSPRPRQARVTSPPCAPRSSRCPKRSCVAMAAAVPTDVLPDVRERRRRDVGAKDRSGDEPVLRQRHACAAAPTSQWARTRTTHRSLAASSSWPPITFIILKARTLTTACSVCASTTTTRSR